MVTCIDVTVTSYDVTIFSLATVSPYAMFIFEYSLWSWFSQ
jgi:hypothetical protein